eukprot:TRINITY_DN8211_c0_g1_i1.p2 TRINITY_DN8211_c0_g1~~TRINITY_DN8211_c0_g1_i1.p2  ORF type:complete len:312 (+),score=96.38 TRINITY_DN8211_c0_g1_i1:67-1002(+)
MAPQLSLKLVYTRQGEVVQRRRRPLRDLSFQGVLRAAEEHSGVRGCLLTYVDDEGDVITLGSAPEWAECVALLTAWGKTCVTVHVDLVGEHAAPPAATSAAAGDAEALRTAQAEAAGLGGERAEPRAVEAEAVQEAQGETPPVTPPGLSAPAGTSLEVAAPPLPTPLAGDVAPQAAVEDLEPSVSTPASLAAPAHDGAVQAAAPPPKCRACHFSQTGIVDGYCCVMCLKYPGQGKHGLRCVRKAFVDAAPPAPQAAVSEPAADEPQPNPEFKDAVAQLVAMGFSASPRVEEVVRACGGDVAAALERLLVEM